MTVCAQGPSRHVSGHAEQFDGLFPYAPVPSPIAGMIWPGSALFCRVTNGIA
jgi:hypothetical protein